MLSRIGRKSTSLLSSQPQRWVSGNLARAAALPHRLDGSIRIILISPTDMIGVARASSQLRSAAVTPTAAAGGAESSGTRSASGAGGGGGGGRDGEPAAVKATRLKNAMQAAITARRIDDFTSAYRQLGRLGPEYIDGDTQHILLSSAKWVGDPRFSILTWKLLQPYVGPNPSFAILSSAILALCAPYVIPTVCCVVCCVVLSTADTVHSDVSCVQYGPCERGGSGAGNRFVTKYFCTFRHRTTKWPVHYNRCIRRTATTERRGRHRLSRRRDRRERRDR